LFIDIQRPASEPTVTIAPPPRRHSTGAPALKDRLKAGETVQMHFYRDSDGREVDLLLTAGSQLHALEIKAGATVNPDYLKGLTAFSAHDPAALASGCVVYGGDEGQAQSDWPVHCWRALAAGRPTA
jgi:hypothetical protein